MKTSLEKIAKTPYYISDDRGNLIYWEGNHGWWKRKIDDNNNPTYYEDSDGMWVKKQYDENDKIIYYEDSDGNYWSKKLMTNIPFPYELNL